MGPCTHFPDEEREVLEKSASAAVTNTIDWWLKPQKCIVSCSGGQEPEIKVLAGLVSPETSLLSLQTAPFLLCPHMVY